MYVFYCAIQILVASSEGVDVDHFPSGGNPHGGFPNTFFFYIGETLDGNHSMKKHIYGIYNASIYKSVDVNPCVVYFISMLFQVKYNL